MGPFRSWFSVFGFRFSVSKGPGSESVSGLRFPVSGGRVSRGVSSSGIKVSSSGFELQGSGIREEGSARQGAGAQGLWSGESQGSRSGESQGLGGQWSGARAGVRKSSFEFRVSSFERGGVCESGGRRGAFPAGSEILHEFFCFGDMFLISQHFSEQAALAFRFCRAFVALRFRSFGGR